MRSLSRTLYSKEEIRPSDVDCFRMENYLLDVSLTNLSFFRKSLLIDHMILIDIHICHFYGTGYNNNVIFRPKLFF